MSLAIPADELSLDSKRNARTVTRRRLIELMVASGKAQNAKQVTIRDVKFNVDLGETGNGDGNEFTPAAGVAGTDLNYINGRTLGNNKYLGVFGFAIVSAFVRPPVVSVRFRIGTGGANVLADLDISRGYAYENPVWYLDDPIIYQPTDVMTFSFEVAVAWAVGQVVFPIAGYLAEPAGQSVM